MNTFLILRRAQYKGHARLVPELLSSKKGKLITLTLKSGDIGLMQLPLQSSIVLGIHEREREPVLIRTSILQNVIHRPSYVELSLRLEDYVTEDARFKAYFKETYREEKHTMVIPLDDPQGHFLTGEELQTERWKEVTETCAVSPYYEECLFFNPVRLGADQDYVQIAIEFYNPQLQEDHNMAVKVLSKDRIAVESIKAERLGVHTITVERERLGDVFSLIGHPFKQFGCIYEIDEHDLTELVAKPESPTTESTKGQNDVERVTALADTPAVPVGWLERLTLRLSELIEDPQNLLTVLRDHLAVIAPEDTTLQSYLGTLYEEIGEYEKAYRVLKQVPVEKMQDEARLAFLRVSNQLGASVDYERVIDFLDLGRDDNIRALASVVQNSVDNRAHSVLRYLLEENPPFDETGIVCFLNDWQDDYQDPNVICSIGEYLYLLLDVNIAYYYLISKVSSNRELIRSEALRTQVLDYATGCDSYPVELCLVLEHELDTAISESDFAKWERVRSLLPKLSKPRAIELLEESACNANLGGMIGVSLLLDLSRLLRESGRTVETIQIMEQATHLVGSNSDLIAAVQKEKEHIHSCLQEMEELTKFLIPAEKASKERLRNQLKGKRMVIIGGREQEWAETLRQELALERVDWKSSERNQRADYSQLEDSIRAGGTDIIVLIYDKVGHTGLDSVKDLAKRNKVAFIESKFGYTSVLLALDRQYSDLSA